MKNLQRIQHLFKQGKANIAYLTAGDGGIQKTLKAALALINGGVNMLEIGIPFSDPVADGPVIQRAAQRAIQQQTTFVDILYLIKEIRKSSNIPLILFSYANPIFKAMQTSFLNEAKRAGIDGILLVDCPIEESQDFHEQCTQLEIAPIYVITPTTSVSRIRAIDQYGKGFLYYACRKGTTGVRSHLPEDFLEKIQHVKSNTQLPVVVGFGISNKETAAEVLQYADGVVVGSLFVKALEDGMKPEELTQLARTIFP
jgi:tryptophan synthase alpha chain